MPNKLNFKILYYTNDGEIGVLINGVRYTYQLDVGFISKIVKLSKQPGKALALLKKVSYHYERREHERRS